VDARQIAHIPFVLVMNIDHDAADVTKGLLDIQKVLHCIAGAEAALKVDGIHATIVAVNEIAQMAIAVNPPFGMQETQELEHCDGEREVDGLVLLEADGDASSFGMCSILEEAIPLIHQALDGVLKLHLMLKLVLVVEEFSQGVYPLPQQQSNVIFQEHARMQKAAPASYNSLARYDLLIIRLSSSSLFQYNVCVAKEDLSTETHKKSKWARRGIVRSRIAASACTPLAPWQTRKAHGSA